MKLEAFSSTIERIYAVAADPAEWGSALTAIEDLTGSVGAVIDFIPRSPAVAPMTMAGRFTLEQCAEFAANYQGICRRLAYGLAHPEKAIHYDAMVLGEDEMDRDPVYDWLGSHGLRYYIGTQLPNSERYIAYASLQRSPAQGHVQADDVHLFELVSGHLGKAIALADRLGTLELGQRVSLEYLDRLPQALFALAGDGRLLFSNRAADALLSEGTVLACVNGHVVACLHGERGRLQRLLAGAARRLHEGGSGWMRLARPDGGPALALFASSFDLRDDGVGDARRCVLLVATDPCRAPELAPEALGELYGLTAAEARIACALANADASAASDHALGIAPETLKSHLKAIFRKLDVHRRQDVVQVVTGLAGVAGSPPNGG